jgi:FkbM family methyltransferase
MKRVLQLIGRFIYKSWLRANTFWKIREHNVQLRASLNLAERLFYLQFRQALVGNDLVVYDIGAADGVFSSCLAKLANVQAVHAFEPISSAFAELSARMQAHTQVTCHNVAVGDINGQTKIWVREGHRDSSSLLKMQELHKEEFPGLYAEYPECVTVVRLDDYVREKRLPPPDVVKIDVQGYEDRVLHGGHDTIGKADYCILEISFLSLYNCSPLFDDIYGQMRALGFRLVGVTGEAFGQSGRQLQVDGIFQHERTE